MKPMILGRRQGAKCVGWPLEGENRVPRCPKLNRSWDDHLLAIQPGHRLAQRYRLQTALPKSA
jgi:hypothetical protein